MEFRIEKDTMGEVQVPVNALYGAQTQRSIDNFKIAQDINRMPIEIIHAFAYLKKAAAITNFEAGVLPKEKSDLIFCYSLNGETYNSTVYNNIIFSDIRPITIDITEENGELAFSATRVTHEDITR